MSTPEETLLVLTNLPDADSAGRIGRLLVERRLAACVNIMAPCTSVYRWNDAVETATEIPLLIQENDVSIPVFDTTKIHAEAAVKFVLG